ncbi:molybdate ABC transporter substrate-binding protein [Methanorbis furvi]|uniref:Molybdate-binding protein ModA n=1 Tax=Methanorbis furvi TaxID=3028299 RepID=A0AAE4MBG3_9EURY|nr:Molybdate-binding protein ModA [Methanocorpusculaceae archaeon Ag1]
MRLNKPFIFTALMVCVVLTVAMAGCIGTTTPEEQPVEIDVYAAASLTGVMTELGNKFMEENKNIKVNFNFAGSQTLKTQILEGADADLYISANNAQFTPVVDAGLIGEKKILLKNKLAIAVPKANSKNITDLAGMAEKNVVLVIGNKDVPFGQYTRDIINKYQNDSHDGYVDAFMANVKSEVDAVDKVKPLLVLDEADASLVYKSDISKADKDDITLIELPDNYNVIADYPYGIINTTKNPEAVKAFESYMTGPVGTALLKDYGFDPVAA